MVRNFIDGIYGLFIIANCSDVAIKQLILALHEEKHFVLKDLDDTHLLIDSAYVDIVKTAVAEILEKNIWAPDSTAEK